MEEDDRESIEYVGPRVDLLVERERNDGRDDGGAIEDVDTNELKSNGREVSGKTGVIASGGQNSDQVNVEDVSTNGSIMSDKEVGAETVVIAIDRQEEEQVNRELVDTQEMEISDNLHRHEARGENDVVEERMDEDEVVPGRRGGAEYGGDGDVESGEAEGHSNEPTLSEERDGISVTNVNVHNTSDPHDPHAPVSFEFTMNVNDTAPEKVPQTSNIQSASAKLPTPPAVLTTSTSNFFDVTPPIPRTAHRIFCCVDRKVVGDPIVGGTGRAVLRKAEVFILDRRTEKEHALRVPLEKGSVEEGEGEGMEDNVVCEACVDRNRSMGLFYRNALTQKASSFADSSVGDVSPTPSFLHPRRSLKPMSTNNPSRHPPQRSSMLTAQLPASPFSIRPPTSNPPPTVSPLNKKS
ncbi:hypothetical protein BC829DRAFT_150090 [Chytridium lagenaria]|nr:hypothetical protein BC829DRAFT_150090 [Chytridium lagenaria]